ncbi:MAG: HAMP domain-containing histidine kinase [Bifidobacteriaceae bacterium]|nr:HAMP domain-containing histidine kinase [Bifidobacteriaceae bacterium]
MRARIRFSTTLAVSVAVVLLGVPMLVFGILTRTWVAVVLVVLGSVGAVVVGSWLASWQARRLSEPMVFLAATAEQLGSGQLRIRAPISGIEEIDLVAEELARSGDRMARRLNLERRFASDASHQLRTPLTALSMRLEEIELASNQPEVKEEARISLEQIHRLAATIDELLGRTRHGALPPRRQLAVADVVSQQEEEWRPAFAAAGRQLVVAAPDGLTVTASHGTLPQVIATLLENSLVHGGGTTTLRARSAQGGIVIEVTDQGPGVADSLAPHIFERSVTNGRGTGLGLAVARDVLAADGGRLELSRRRPPLFTVFLPAN